MKRRRSYHELSHEEQEAVVHDLIDLTRDDPDLLEDLLERLPPAVVEHVLEPFVQQHQRVDWTGTLLEPLASLHPTAVSLNIEHDTLSSNNWITFSVQPAGLAMPQQFRLVQTGHNDVTDMEWERAAAMVDLANKKDIGETSLELQKLGWQHTNTLQRLLLAHDRSVLMGETRRFLQETLRLFADLVMDLVLSSAPAETPVTIEILVLCRIGLERSLVFLHVMALALRLLALTESSSSVVDVLSKEAAWGHGRTVSLCLPLWFF